MAAIKDKTLNVAKDNTSRVRYSGTGPDQQGSGAENHWLVGRMENHDGNRVDDYHVTAQLALDWENVGRVLSAELVVTSPVSSAHLDMGNTGRMTLRPVHPSVDVWSEGNEGEDSWNSNEFVKPKLDDAPQIVSDAMSRASRTAWTSSGSSNTGARPPSCSASGPAMSGAGPDQPGLPGVRDHAAHRRGDVLLVHRPGRGE